MELEIFILPTLPWAKVPSGSYSKGVTPLGRRSITRPAYLEMYGGIDEREVNELTNRGVAIIETPFGQERLDADPGLTLKVDAKRAWAAQVLQVPERIISRLHEGRLLAWYFKILCIYDIRGEVEQNDKPNTYVIIPSI